MGVRSREIGGIGECWDWDECGIGGNGYGIGIGLGWVMEGYYEVMMGKMGKLLDGYGHRHGHGF